MDLPPEHDPLIPPSDMYFEDGVPPDQFVIAGNAFLWNLLVARTRLQPADAVLDIGSGNGKMARGLTTYLTGEGRYEGFDIMKHWVDWCSGAYANLPNFTFRHAELRSDWYAPEAAVLARDYVFPYEDNTFDVAFAVSLFTHLMPEEASNYLRETCRLLKPGGRLLATCYLVNDINQGRHAEAVQGSRFTRASDQHWLLDPEHPSRGVAFDEIWLRSEVEAAGMRGAEIYYGRWANGQDVLGMLQDCMLIVKPGGV